MRRTILVVLALLVVAASARAALDPVVERKNYAKTLERQALSDSPGGRLAGPGSAEPARHRRTTKNERPGARNDHERPVELAQREGCLNKLPRRGTLVRHPLPRHRKTISPVDSPSYADKIRAANTAALRALSTPTHATGTPGGICEIDNNASRPPATEVEDVSGTPITGSDYAGQRGRQARSGDDHAQAAHARVLCVLRDHLGVAVGGHHADLVEDSALLEFLGGLLHLRHVGLGAHDDADAGGVDLEHAELGVDFGFDGGFAHAAMSRR
jgi:hypothetical protein